MKLRKGDIVVDPVKDIVISAYLENGYVPVQEEEKKTTKKKPKAE